MQRKYTREEFIKEFNGLAIEQNLEKDWIEYVNHEKMNPIVMLCLFPKTKNHGEIEAISPQEAIDVLKILKFNNNFSRGYSRYNFSDKFIADCDCTTTYEQSENDINQRKDFRLKDFLVKEFTQLFLDKFVAVRQTLNTEHVLNDETYLPILKNKISTLKIKIDDFKKTVVDISPKHVDTDYPKQASLVEGTSDGDGRNNFKKSTSSENPLYTKNTSDHTYQSIVLQFETNRKSYEVKGFTWNLLDKMFSKDESRVNSYSNNPWNENETFEQYIERKRRQTQKIISLINEGADFFLTQEVDIFRVRNEYTDEQKKEIKSLQDKFIQDLNKRNWGIEHSSRYDHPVTTFYNKNTLDKVSSSGIIPYHSPSDMASGNRGMELIVKHKASGKLINLSNVHLRWGSAHHDAFNQELDRHQEKCFDRGQVLIVGGDFNGPKEGFSNSIGYPDSKHTTNIRGEVLSDDEVYLKRSYEQRGHGINKEKRQETKTTQSFDFFKASGTKEVSIREAEIGGEEFKKQGRGKYVITQSKEKKLYPNRSQEDGSYTFTNSKKFNNLTSLLNDFRNEILATKWIISLGGYVYYHHNKAGKRINKHIPTNVSYILTIINDTLDQDGNLKRGKDLEAAAVEIRSILTNIHDINEKGNFLLKFYYTFGRDSATAEFYEKWYRNYETYFTATDKTISPKKK